MKRYSRILKGFESRFRALLQSVGARKLDKGVRALVAAAQRLSAVEHVSPADAHSRICDTLAGKVARQRSRNEGFDQHARVALPHGRGSVRFFCDEGLGGLARWLRAAGYEAFWEPDIQDHELIKKASELWAVILTTDSGMMERRVLRDNTIISMWLPPSLSIPDQLATVFREFRLRVGEPRCMSCGGELGRESKEALKDRIPPKTYLWLDEYFVCKRCGKLFWHGTHWVRIQRTLNSLSTTEEHR